VIPVLERAAGYALEAASGVTPELLGLPTPCRGWNLGMLLTHADESLAALHEGIGAGSVALVGSAPVAADPVATFRERVTSLLRVSHASRAGLAPGDDGGDRVITIAGRPMTLRTLTAVAALELAVHGWDVSAACGHRLPIPPALATDLLELSWLLVPPAGRYPLFAPPVPVPGDASPGDRLTAFLGRRPG